MRTLMLLAAAALLLIVIGTLLSDEGEVVTLKTTDGQAQVFKTRLWVVDLDGRPHLRGNSERAWVERLRAQPLVTLTRDGRTESYRAVIVSDRAMIDAVSRAMREKYGAVEKLIEGIFDNGHSLAIRLEPIPPHASAQAPGGGTLP
ncbi:MAG: hypothetical protein OEM05_08525 [Myxococcales bacterium]|nr:hypothetical protein [Myxococcales bacterium]